MSQEQSTNSVPFKTKAAYIGAGVLVGLVIYPLVRRGLKKAQPALDEMLGQLSGKTEELAEKASDMLAKVREARQDSKVATNETSGDSDHSH